VSLCRSAFLILPLLFAGCAGDATVRSAPVAPLGSPFTGTWHQTPAAAQTPTGFLALDAGRVVFNLDGQARGPVAITANETDAGLRSGRVVCADGRILFLAVGDSLTTRESADGRLLAPTPHLDVQVFAAGAGPAAEPQHRLRLWPAAALAVAMLPASVARPAAPQAPTAVALPPQDQQLHAAFGNDPWLATVAARLTQARADGRTPEELDLLYRRSVQVLRGEVVRDLDAGRRGDRSALARADERLADLSRADTAYATWRSRR
jgi:hypothetical protein